MSNVQKLPEHHFLIVYANDLPSMREKIMALLPPADVHVLTETSVTIDVVRSLKEIAYRRPVDYAMRYLIVTLRNIKLEAQHALLKVLEEPPVSTRFIFIVAPSVAFLDTITSRGQVYQVAEEKGVTSPQFEQFLSWSYPERVANLQKVSRDDEEWWVAMNTGLQHWCRTHVLQCHQELLDSMTYLSYHGAMKKMLWEQIAYLLPQSSR